MRTFDPNAANRLVPVLAETFGRLRPLVEQVQQLDRAQEHPSPDAAMQRQRLLEELQREVAALEELGIEVKSADGLVDFRAVRAGRPVYLCWRYGEAEVRHWHPIDAGYAGRQPLESDEPFEPSYLS